MSSQPDVSVVIRARDEIASMGRCLDLLLGQRLEQRTFELVLVDGGSRDGTIEAARGHGARVVTIPPQDFTFGGALNLGCANARGPLLVSLSAHAFPRDSSWLSRLLEPFEDPRVACAAGDAYAPDGARLVTRVEQDIALARRRPEWGYSNAAGAFRAELWRRRPFRSDLIACEDKEWAWHWLERGYLCVVDPSFVVEHDHTHDPLRQIYGRARREAEGLTAFLGSDRYGPTELAREWWAEPGTYRSAVKARLSHRRAARLLGAYAGRRRARRRVRRTRARRSESGS
jgi:rhamnosyltransferase